MKVWLIAAALLLASGCDRSTDERLSNIEASLNRIEAFQNDQFPQLPAPMSESDAAQIPENTLFLAPDGSIRRKGDRN